MTSTVTMPGDTVTEREAAEPPGLGPWGLSYNHWDRKAFFLKPEAWR
jgi:hypothetical protein